MNRQKSLNRIAELLSRFSNEVKMLNSASLYDINIHSENILIPLINEAFDLNLINANFDEEKNYSAVDLIDNKNRVSFQVTSSADNEKIKHTLNQFVKHERFNDYDILFIYIISEKQASYTGKGHTEIIDGKFSFDKDENILDNNDLFKKIAGLVSFQKIRNIEELLEAEFTDAKIEARRKNLENPQEKKHTEKVYPNLLEVIIPEYLYIADINIDREAIIKRTWEEKYKLKLDASDRKVLRKALEYDEVEFFRDWHTSGNQLLTFRNLNDNTEPLSNYIDKGTVTKISCDEYWAAKDTNLRIFSALLNFTLQEKLAPKAINFIAKEGIFRFGSDSKIIKSRSVTWKKTKKATRTVLFEMLDKEKAQIVCFKHFSFYVYFHFFNEQWYLTINPTWSFTSDGYKKSGLSKFYASGLKRLENNKTIFYAFLFISFCLNNQITTEQEYPLLSFKEPEYEMISTAYEIMEDEFEGDEADTIIQ
jgi:hypothetical protein